MMDEMKYLKQKKKKAELLLSFEHKKHILGLTHHNIILGTGIAPVNKDYVFDFGHKIAFSDNFFKKTIKLEHAKLIADERRMYQIKPEQGIVYVNGKTITKETLLEHKDKVQLGESRNLKIQIIYG